MKNKYFIAAVILFLAGLLFTGCNNKRENVEDAEENVKEAKQELIDAKAEYAQEWQQFKKDAESRINDNEKKISDFKASIRTASGKSKAKYEQEVLELERKNVESRKKLSEYNYDGKDSWETFKKEFNDGLDYIGNTLNDIFTRND
ncbi:MAG TPA: hypothetical protein VK870_12225 [Ignavibacteriaceae bacterium]|nr:hypothetical protein [Ignavibacteriaceae bacterium]